MNTQARKKGGKVEKVMKEFGAGKLKSSSGQKVTNPKQAIAIGLSEQRRAKGLKAGVNNPKTNMGKADFKFKEGGAMKESKMMVKKEIEFFKKKGAPKSMIKHEEKEAKGKGKMTKMARGGMFNTTRKAKTFPTASAARKDMDEITVTAPRIKGAGRLEEAVVTAPRIKGAGYARGGGIESKGKTRGKFV